MDIHNGFTPADAFNKYVSDDVFNNTSGKEKIDMDKLIEIFPDGVCITSVSKHISKYNSPNFYTCTFLEDDEHYFIAKGSTFAKDFNGKNNSRIDLNELFRLMERDFTSLEIFNMNLKKNPLKLKFWKRQDNKNPAIWYTNFKVVSPTKKSADKPPDKSKFQQQLESKAQAQELVLEDVDDDQLPF